MDLECQLNGLSILVPMFKGKVYIRNCCCCCYGVVKLLERGMKVVERFCRMVSIDEMQFGFMPEIGAIDAVFVLGRMQEEYHAKGKSYIFVLWT